MRISYYIHHTRNMKILYVADNRNRGNYGCRATSTALSQLISTENEIVGRVSGRYTHNDTGNMYFLKGMPRIFYNIIGKMDHWCDIKVGLYLFHNMKKRHGKIYFSKYDFLSLDLDKSIDNLIKCLPANPELREFDIRQYDFDAMVVNGEGSFIFCTPPWRESIVITMLMHWAQKMGKKVFFVNAMFSDSPNTAHNERALKVVYNTLKKCDLIAVREMVSYSYAKKYMPALKPVIIPDALFSWFDLINDGHKIVDGKYYMDHRIENDVLYKDFRFDMPYICVTGSSASGECIDKKEISECYIKIVMGLKERFPEYKVYIVEACEGDAFLQNVASTTNTMLVGLCTPIVAVSKILANARLYITGRYHPAIMASMGGTPCVFLSSNSHKTYSLQQLLQYQDIHEYNLIYSENEYAQIMDMSASYLHQGEELRKVIKNRCYTLSIETKQLCKITTKAAELQGLEISSSNSF